jgi:excisionase family DNA binding protein
VPVSVSARPPAWLTIAEAAEAAEVLKVTDRTVRNYIADGRLHVERIGPRLVRSYRASLGDLGTGLGNSSASVRGRIVRRDAAASAFRARRATLRSKPAARTRL